MVSNVLLYDYWRSSASYRVRIALNLKNIPFDTQPVNLLSKEHKSAAHLKRNPQGLVPALSIDGHMLTQSLAILQYLEDTRPTPPLFPSEPLEKARALAIAHAIAMETHPVSNLSVAVHAGRLGDDGDEGKANWIRHYITQGLTAVETMLPTNTRYCSGDRPGIVDCCLVPQVYNAERWGVDLSVMPKVVALASDCHKLAAFADAHPDNTPH